MITFHLVLNQDVGTLACYIDLPTKYFRKKVKFKTFINQTLRKFRTKYTTEKLVNLFHIPVYILERPIRYCGRYIACLQAICGLIAGEKIFTTQWHGRYALGDPIRKNIFTALKQEGCIVLIPASHKNPIDNSYIPIDMDQWDLKR